MSGLPEPMTPLNCDLRDYEWMPLFGQRLFGSSFNDTASDAEFRAALRLWWASWQECPAGSLPADDASLARRADFGRDVKSWLKVKAKALHGFVLCSDGRLYHPMLCEEAILSFARKLKSDAKRTADRARLQAWRDAQRDARVAAATSPTGNATETQTETPDETRFVAGRPDQTRPDQGKEAARPLPVPDSRAPQPVRDAMSRIVNPSPNDPPTAWMHLADRNPDGTPKIEDWPGNPGHGCPKCAGTQLNIVAGLLCDAAGLGLDWRGDWRLLIAWLRDGLDFHDVILPAVQRVASRAGYQPPSTLRYFEGAVREAAGRMRA